jgi:hypothetical protein
MNKKFCFLNRFFSPLSFCKKLIFEKQLNIFRILVRDACPSVDLPTPLSEDVDLGLIEPVSSMSLSGESSMDAPANEVKSDIFVQIPTFKKNFRQ